MTSSAINSTIKILSCIFVELFNFPGIGCYSEEANIDFFISSVWTIPKKKKKFPQNSEENVTRDL